MTNPCRNPKATIANRNPRHFREKHLLNISQSKGHQACLRKQHKILPSVTGIRGVWEKWKTWRKPSVRWLCMEADMENWWRMDPSFQFWVCWCIHTVDCLQFLRTGLPEGELYDFILFRVAYLLNHSQQNQNTVNGPSRRRRGECNQHGAVYLAWGWWAA